MSPAAPTGRYSARTCTDAWARPVPYVPNNSIPKTGLATLVNGQPVVYLKVAELRMLPPVVAEFLYAHECGHHALGQVVAGFLGLPIGPEQELAADCFALRTLAGAMTPPDRQGLMQFLAQVPGDPTTYPGPARVQRLSGC
ncbi:MAG: hypothetical protein ACK52I_28820 [Pseudomonadota bacterium]